MAKYKLQIFDRVDRISESSGAKRAYLSRSELSRPLGQGDTILFHGHVYGQTANGRLSFVVSTGCHGDVRPFDDGFSVTLAGTFGNIVTIGNFKFNTAEDFMHELEVVADVDDSTASGTESVDFDLWATIIQA